MTTVVTPTAAPADERPNPVDAYLDGLAAGSHRTMRGALLTMANLLTGGMITDPREYTWWRLAPWEVDRLRTQLAQRYAPATANKHLAALRGVLRSCRRVGRMSGEACIAACDVKPVRGERVEPGRALASGELGALFRACAGDHTAAGRRDAAMLALLYGTGLRRSELVSLDLADWNAQTGAITVRHGKGNKQRLVYAAGGAQEALLEWLEVRGNQEGPLFYQADPHGGVRPRGLHSQAVLRVTAKRSGAVQGMAPFSPHDLRRTMIGDLLSGGNDISVVQKLAGHASVTTTQRYDRRGEQVKREAAASLHVPFVGATR